MASSSPYPTNNDAVSFRTTAQNVLKYRSSVAQASATSPAGTAVQGNDSANKEPENITTGSSDSGDSKSIPRGIPVAQFVKVEPNDTDPPANAYDALSDAEKEIQRSRIREMFASKGIKSCDALKEEAADDVARLGEGDLKKWTQLCETQFTNAVEQSARNAYGVSDDVLAKLVDTSRKNLQSSIPTIRSQLDAALQAHRHTQEIPTWSEWFKSNGIKYATLGIASGTAVGIATGSSVSGGVSALASMGILAYFDLKGIDPLAFIMDKIKKAFENPQWIALTLAKFKAIKKVVCKILHTLVLGVAATAIGFAGLDRRDYISVRMEDLDRESESYICSTLSTMVSATLNDPKAVNNVLSGAASAVGTMMSLSPITAVAGSAISSGVGALMHDASSSATSGAMSATSIVFQSMVFEQALTQSVSQMLELLDLGCVHQLVPRILTIRRAMCQNAPSLPDYAQKNDNMLARMIGYVWRHMSTIGCSDDLEKDGTWQMSAEYTLTYSLGNDTTTTTANNTPFNNENGRTSPRITDKIKDGLAMFYNSNSSAGSSEDTSSLICGRACLLHEIIYPGAEGEGGLKNNVITDVLEQNEHLQHVHNQDANAFFQVPPIKEIVHKNSSDPTICFTFVCLPVLSGDAKTVGDDAKGTFAAFYEEMDNLKDHLKQYDWKLERKIISDKEFKKYTSTKMYVANKFVPARRLQDSYVQNCILWGSYIWDGTSSDEYNRLIKEKQDNDDVRDNVAKTVENSSSFVSAVAYRCYSASVSAASSGMVWLQGLGMQAKDYFSSKEHSITGGELVSNSAGNTGARLFAVNMLSKKKRLVGAMRACLVSGDLQRYMHLNEFLETCKMFGPQHHHDSSSQSNNEEATSSNMSHLSASLLRRVSNEMNKPM